MYIHNAEEVIWTIINVIHALLIVVGTSVLTTTMTFLSLRWVFGKLAKGFETFTKMGASQMGVKSGISRGTKAAMDSAAKNVLSSPKIAGIKMLASQFGFDIDSMIEEHGSVETLAAINQVLGLLGIDMNTFLEKGLKGLLGSVTKVKSGLP